MRLSIPKNISRIALLGHQLCVADDCLELCKPSAAEETKAQSASESTAAVQADSKSS
jgi:hypothetical protein